MSHLATRRLLPGAAGALLLAATLTACGGGPGADAPDDASKEAFCTGFGEDAPGEGASAEEVHDYAEKLAETGTPAEITGDAREGFEIFVDFAADVSDDDIKEFDASAEPADVFDGDEADKVAAFTSKYLEVCLGDLADLPTDAPS